MAGGWNEGVFNIPSNPPFHDSVIPHLGKFPSQGWPFSGTKYRYPWEPGTASHSHRGVLKDITKPRCSGPLGPGPAPRAASHAASAPRAGMQGGQWDSTVFSGGGEPPKCWCSCGAVNYSPGGELRDWIEAPEGIPCTEQHCQAQAPADLCWELQDVLGSCSRWSGGARSCLKPSVWAGECLSSSQIQFGLTALFLY